MADEKRTKIVAEIQVDAKEAQGDTQDLLKVIQNLETELRTMQGLVAKNASGLNESAEAAETMNDALEGMRDNTEDVANAQEKVDNALKDVNRSQKEAGRLAEIFKGIWQGVGQAIFRSVVGAFRGVVGAIVDTMDRANEFGDTFDLMAEKGVEGAKALREETAALATELRVDMLEAAKAVNAVAMFGKDDADRIEVARIALQNYAVTGAGAAQTIELSSQLVRGFNLAGTEQADVIDQVAQAAIRAKVPQTELYEALAKISPQAAATGIKFRELLAITEAGVKRGIQPMRMGLMGMGEVMESLWNPTEKVAEALAAQGKSVRELISENGLAGYVRFLQATPGALEGFSGAARTFIQSVPAQLQVATGPVETLEQTLRRLGRSVTDLQQLAKDNPEIAAEALAQVKAIEAEMAELKLSAEEGTRGSVRGIQEIWNDLKKAGFGAFEDLQNVANNFLTTMAQPLDEIRGELSGLWTELFTEENRKKLEAEFKKIGESIKGYVMPIAQGVVNDIQAGINGEKSWEVIIREWTEKGTTGILDTLKSLVKTMVDFIVAQFQSREVEIGNSLGAILGRAFRSAWYNASVGFGNAISLQSIMDPIANYLYGANGTAPVASYNDYNMSLVNSGASTGFDQGPTKSAGAQVNVTNHIYGTDPRVTADMVSRRLQDQARLGVTGGRVF